MDEPEWRALGSNLVIILSGALLGWALAVVPYPSILAVIVLAIAIIVFFLPKSFLYLKVFEVWWKWNYPKRFENPRIGIMNGFVKSDRNEVRCISGYTQFSPEDWRNRFEGRINVDRRYFTELIPAKKIGNEYAVIINPFGELYPEEDLFTRKTFQAIKKFIQEGGIFVHAGGFPFYYSWDTTSGRRNPTSRDQQLFALDTSGKRPLIVQAYEKGARRLASLDDTLVRLEFLLRTTTAYYKSPIVDAFQEQPDLKFGQLTQVGGTRKIHEFRAATDETPKIIPFLRCKAKYIDTVVYPLAGIPFGRGVLVVAGMDFGLTATDSGVRIAEAQLAKVCSLITNLVNWFYAGHLF